MVSGPCDRGLDKCITFKCDVTVFHLGDQPQTVFLLSKFTLVACAKLISK